MAETFATTSAVAAALPGQRVRLVRGPWNAEGTGTWGSLWKVGGLPGLGATPPTGNGEIPTSATVGAIPFTNASVGGRIHIGGLWLAGGSVGTLILYDRLWHNSGFSGNTTGAQDIASPPTLTRPDALGAGVELWGEVYTAMGATGSVFTATVVNQSGAGSTATYTMPANALSVGQMFPFQLASGDYGVRSVSRVQLGTLTGTAGDFGLVLMRRIIEIPVMVAGTGQLWDAFDCCLQAVDNGACIAAQWFANSTSINPLDCRINLIES